MEVWVRVGLSDRINYLLVQEIFFRGEGVFGLVFGVFEFLS